MRERTLQTMGTPGRIKPALAVAVFHRRALVVSAFSLPTTIKSTRNALSIEQRASSKAKKQCKLRVCGLFLLLPRHSLSFLKASNKFLEASA